MSLQLVEPFEVREERRLASLGVTVASCLACTSPVKVYEQLLPVHDSDAVGDLCLFLAVGP